MLIFGVDLLGFFMGGLLVVCALRLLDIPIIFTYFLPVLL